MEFLFLMKQKYQITSIYATYGISNQVEVVFVLPYITARGNATQEVLKFKLRERKKRYSGRFRFC
jgi:hypothetical protein